MSKNNTAASPPFRQPAFSGEDPLLSPDEAASLAELSLATMRDYRSTRDLKRGPPFLKDGRVITYRLSDLLSWIDRRTER